MEEYNFSEYNRDILIQVIKEKMPFGKYKGVYIYELPVYYLEWFAQQGFPKGKLGVWLSTIYEIKINGLEDILKPLIVKIKNG